MKRSILLLVAIVLSTGLLAGCADWPVEEEVEVGYRSGEPATGERVEVAAEQGMPLPGDGRIG